MPNLKDLLKELEKVERRYGSSLRQPSSEGEILKLSQTFKQRFNELELPKQYIEFLRIVNGLDFNGLVIYGVDQDLLDGEAEEEIQGFIELNELWHENNWHRKYLFFGDSDTAWYCFDNDKNQYFELDKPSGTIMNSFEDFNSMISNALETSLL